MRKKIASCIAALTLCVLCMAGGFQSQYKGNREALCSSMENLFHEAGIDKENDAQYLDAIRNYAYANLEWAVGREYYREMKEVIFEGEVSWEEMIYSLFSKDTIEATGYCWGTAYALATLYNILGYDACALDMAVFDQTGKVVGSHVVTLVKLEDKWIVEDATFNVTYKKEGEHISIQELVKSVRAREIKNIEVEEGAERYKRACFSEPGYEGSYLLKEPVEFKEFAGGGYYSYLDMKPEMWSAFDELYIYFEKDGYDKSVLSIYAYPYAVYWPKNCNMKWIERKLLEKSILE